MGKIKNIRNKIKEYKLKRLHEKFFNELINFNGDFKKLNRLSNKKEFNINYDRSKSIYYAALVNGRRDLIKFILNFYHLYYGTTINKGSFYYKKTIKYIVNYNQVEKFKLFISTNFTIDSILHNNGENLIETIGQNNQIEIFKSLLVYHNMSTLKYCANNLYHTLVKVNNLDMILILSNYYNNGNRGNIFGMDYLISSIFHFRNIEIFKYLSDNKMFTDYDYNVLLSSCFSDNRLDFLKNIIPIINNNHKKSDLLYFFFLRKCIDNNRPDIFKILVDRLNFNYINDCIENKTIWQEDLKRFQSSLNDRLNHIIINGIGKDNNSKIFINTVLTNSFLLKSIRKSIVKYFQPSYKPKKINRTV